MAAERRLVTVLFADCTGSTTLGEILDPEDVRVLLARFYAIAKDIITAHGGTLEKFIGDAVMAVFGLPQAHGDDAKRALSAALELRDKVRVDPTLGPRLPIRIGLNTGEVVATSDITTGDFLVTGDAVNVAARLQQTADPWMILSGDRTAQAARNAFSFGPPVDVSTKGKSHTVRAVVVLERVAAPSVQKRIPLIGRDADLAQIELMARRAFTEHRPFLVSLVAPAGIGKTRLVEEFLERLSALAPEARIAVAQCLPYGQRLTYWPLRSILFKVVGAPGDTSPEVLHDALEEWLRDAGVAAPDRVANFLAATVGLGETEVPDRDALFAAWRTAVEAATRSRPLVLVFEDLHWSSDSLLDLVEFIMQPRGAAAVLVIALFRPELLERRPAWGGGRRNYLSLDLEPLDDGSIGALVNHLLGERIPEVAERVIGRAEGNPFYAGEIVRTIIERVPSLEDRAAVEGVLTTLPDTVQATLQARLDILPPDERRVLRLGAIFGRAFRTAGIAALLPDLRREEVNRLINQLARKDLVIPSEEDRFIFRHILIREVAYQTLSRAERARLHAAAGRWLENDAAGRENVLAELIAYHYREAALVGNTVAQGEPDSRETRRKAVQWLARAGEIAAGTAASIEASRHLRSAIELAEPDVLPDLYELLGRVHHSGDVAADAYRSALRLCRETGRPVDQKLRILGGLLNTYMRWMGSVETWPSEEGIQELRAAGHALIDRVHDERAIANFLIADAFYPFWRWGEVEPPVIDEAEVAARRGLDLAQKLGDAGLQSAALDALTGCSMARGSWEDGRTFARHRLLLAERLGVEELADAHRMLAWTSFALGDLYEAARASAAGLALLQPGQAPRMALALLGWRISILAVMGQWDEAILTAGRAVKVWEEIGRPATLLPVLGYMSARDIARARQNHQLVERYSEILEEILGRLTSDAAIRMMRAYLKRDLEILETEVMRTFRHGIRFSPVERALALCTDRGRPAAPGLVQSILEYAAERGLRLLEAQAQRALGVARGDSAALRAALSIFESIGAEADAARTRCEWALLTGQEQELTIGMRILERLGDLDYLRRVEQLRRGSQISDANEPGSG